MSEQIKIYNNHIIISLIFIFISTCLYSQDKLNYGTTSLTGKKLQVDKYDCKITPSFNINEDIPETIKLNFNIVWIDKKGSQVGHPDKITLFIKVNNNIEEYCASNRKKLSTVVYNHSQAWILLGKKYLFHNLYPLVIHTLSADCQGMEGASFCPPLLYPTSKFLSALRPMRGSLLLDPLRL